jgi:hypothetical protein
LFSFIGRFLTYLWQRNSDNTILFRLGVSVQSNVSLAVLLVLFAFSIELANFPRLPSLLVLFTHLAFEKARLSPTKATKMLRDFLPERLHLLGKFGKV